MKHIKTIIPSFFIALLAFNCKTDKKEEIIKIIEQPKIIVDQTEVNNKNYDNMIKEAIDEALKTSTRVNIDSIAKDLILIKEHSFYKISPGDSIISHLEKFKKEVLKNGEDDFIGYAVYGEKNTKLAIVHPKEDNLKDNKKAVIGSIEIISDKAKTKDGISIGMTFGDLLKKHPDIIVHGSEIEEHTYAKHGNISYLLDANFKTYKVDKAKINRKVKIKSITIN